MSAKTKEVGGGPATGLADSFVKWLSQGLNSGTFGTGSPAGGDAVGATQGISGYLNDVLSGGAGKLGGSMASMIGKETDRGAAALRARFGVGGGTAFGTPGANAEALFRSEEAPKLATAVGGLQSNALQMLLPIFANIAGKGLSQRQLQTSENPWMTAGKLGLAGGSMAAGLMTGNPALVAGGMGGLSNLGAGAQDSIMQNINAGGFGQDWKLPDIPLPSWMN